MKFDHYTVTILMLRPDAPQMSEETLGQLQDEHLAHLSQLHDEGVLLIAGPLLGAEDRQFRGLSIWRAEPERVQQLIAEHPDPAVAAGRFSQAVVPWMVPSGAMDFSHTHLPRSRAEAVPG
jgi:uncharacterized protein YciI